MPALPDWMNPRRVTIVSPKNPLDKSTIISIYPREIVEINHTINPGKFVIPPGTRQNPSALIVGSSVWWREIDPEQPLLEITVSSIQVADSVIKDFSNGLIECNMSDSRPGLFFIPGEWTMPQVLKEKKALLDEIDSRQNNWYRKLVRLADMLWAETRGNPLAIPEDSKIAAQQLGIDKQWLRESAMLEYKKCMACSTLINSAVVVCPNCKVIVDPVKFKEMNLEFAK